jgi:hypothetical protein
VRVEDLPGGWFQEREWRWRYGFMGKTDFSRRASQAKLIAAARRFELVGTQTWLLVQAVPFPSVEDAQAWLENVWQVPWWRDPTALTQVEAEVEPAPAAAGEHARALVVNTTFETGPRRTLFCVAWREAQPMAFLLQLGAPTEYDRFDAMSMLIKLQRARSSSTGR